MKTFKKILMVVMVVTIGVLAVQLHYARYEIRLQKESNQNWSDFSYFQDSNRVTVTSNLNQRIEFLQRTNR